MLRAIVSAAKLDTSTINFILTSEAQGLWLSSHPLTPRRGSVARAFGRMLKRWISSLGKGDLLDWLSGEKIPVTFYAETKNQYDAFATLHDRRDDGSLVVGGKLRDRRLPGRVTTFPLTAALTLAALFLPLVFFRWIRSDGYSRLSFRYSFDAHWMSYGIYLTWVAYLTRHRVECAVISSDISPVARALVAAAGYLGVRTVYLQHASVTETFPKLEVDVALLEGVDALEKYGRAGTSESTVYLIGMCKADRISPREKVKKVAAIGVCSNDLDEPGDITTLLAVLNNLPDKSVVLRPHPRTRPKPWAEFEEAARATGCRISDSRAVDVMEFLNDVDMIVAGESSIHLEAALRNIPSLYYVGSNSPLDVYGYSRRGLVSKPISRPADLVETIRSISHKSHNVRTRCKHYVDTIGTSADGNSTALADSVISDLLTGGEHRDGRWRAMPYCNFSNVWRICEDGRKSD